jgi:hypothetical protein
MQSAPHPRMKIAAPLLRGGGELHIVGNDRVVTLHDPDGAIHRLVELADGSRSTNELFSALAPDYPSLQHGDVVEAVSELEAAGLFETCAPQRRILGGRDSAQLPSLL